MKERVNIRDSNHSGNIISRVRLLSDMARRKKDVPAELTAEALMKASVEPTGMVRRSDLPEFSRQQVGAVLEAARRSRGVLLLPIEKAVSLLGLPAEYKATGQAAVLLASSLHRRFAKVLGEGKLKVGTAKLEDGTQVLSFRYTGITQLDIEE